MRDVPDTTPTVLAGWQLHANRHATLWIDAAPLHLRPPNLGEFRSIRDDTTVAHEAIAELVLAADERRKELEEAVKAETAPVADAKAELAKLSAEINERTDTAHWTLLRDVIERFSGTALPGDDLLPPWLVEQAAESLANLVGHWRSVPPPLGAG